MTDSIISHLSEAEERHLIDVEMDVRRAMKEACRFYQHEVRAALEIHRQKKARLAKMRALAASVLLIAILSGCIPATPWTAAQGFEVAVGINPITGVDHQKTLYQKDFQRVGGKY